MDALELAERTGIDVEHIRDQERAARTKTCPSVFDISLAHVEPYIFDIRQIINDVTGTASKVEHPIAGARSKMVDDDRTLERPGPYDALVETKRGGPGEH